MKPKKTDLDAPVLPRIRAATDGKSTSRALTAAKGDRLRPWGKPWRLDNMVYAYDHSEAMRRAYAISLGVTFAHVASLTRGGGVLGEWLRSFAAGRTVLARKLRESSWVGLTPTQQRQVMRRYARENYDDYAKFALLWLDDLEAVANAERVHPVDVAEFFVALDQSDPGAHPRLVSMLKSGRVSPRNRVMQQASQFVEVISRKATKLYKFKGIPQRPSATGTVYGFEIVEIEYAVANDFDNHGNPTGWSKHAHQSASVEMGNFAGLRSEHQELLKYTPMGRLYLCFNKELTRMFIASDRKPSRPPFVVGGGDPRDRATFQTDSQLKADKTVNGFVF